jgi:hypothetical protein
MRHRSFFAVLSLLDAAACADPQVNVVLSGVADVVNASTAADARVQISFLFADGTVQPSPAFDPASNNSNAFAAIPPGTPFRIDAAACFTPELYAVSADPIAGPTEAEIATGCRTENSILAAACTNTFVLARGESCTITVALVKPLPNTAASPCAPVTTADGLCDEDK